MQEELDDDDEWNPCKAAGVCLMLMATCCEDDVVPHVLPFVKNHIRDQDWRFRDAAVMAFGKLKGMVVPLLYSYPFYNEKVGLKGRGYLVG